MKIGALTKAIMGKNAAKSELQQFGVEIFMRVVLFVRSAAIPLYEHC